MICPVLPAGLDLDSFVADLLQEWAPDCEFVDVSPSPPPPSPPSLLDLFDVSEVDSPTSEDDDVVVVADSPAADTESCVCLSTPAVSPITVYSASPNVTEDMLQCLEDMATFDEDDEVRSEASSFTSWSDNVDVASCPAQGCLRCAFYQSRGESAICGLCYLKALSAVQFPPRGCPWESAMDVGDGVVAAGDFGEGSGLAMTPPVVYQTEPLDLSTRPRP
ncbi:E1A [Bat mastadenovirus A]|uniref:E1A n=1 Tax=Bat mastadenovirus A TaxID=1146877 RepID=A0A3G9E9U9_9ADEN|nr:E1A [Bat mastadenovirus A]